MKGFIIQGPAKKLTLGRMNPASWLPLAGERECTQPRAHLLADPCTFVDDSYDIVVPIHAYDAICSFRHMYHKTAAVTFLRTNAHLSRRRMMQNAVTACGHLGPVLTTLLSLINLHVFVINQCCQNCCRV